MSIESASRALILALTLASLGARADTPAPAAKAPSAAAAEDTAAIAAARQAAEAAGIKVTDLKVGKGHPALAGAYVRVDYTGWLKDMTKPDGKGMKFDSSVDRGDPFLFTLGQRKVIQGWDLGVAGMQPGGKRLLEIPPEAGYGANGTPGGPIPPNATLVFEVRLYDFLPPLSHAVPGSAK